MGMTRKHFQDMADRLQHCKPSPENNPLYMESYSMWRRMVWEMVDFCRNQNAAFNTQRFVDACGMEEES